MRIKRYCSLFLAVLLALGASGCGAAGHEAMTIQPAQLSADEEALGQLLDVDMDFYHIFDFQTEGGNSAKKTGVQSVQLTLYELADGEWAPLIQDREAFSDTSGRIALSFGKIAEGVRIAVQGENSFSSRTQDMTPGDDVLSMAHATSMLTSTTTIELDKETPLVIQIATTKGEIRSYGVEYFGMPREYAKHGYEHVYAITVMFSKKAVQELAGAAADPTTAP